ncbi:uncharacterized protein LOC131651609 isoform X1 [Vicia villosa]|uniref:uncharacterized protein LOC131651609 isoform X1 n=1 Tax=Vicia villosa TaxID=3911 RepID=UPI00273B9247|nr:uncharacterized protein LOC131651609 isoform X1 [Vicia villosa]XP_058777251.1 uncharacterized protein LOC131651609 isoform X1 [Vicia villosa]
MNFLIRSTTSVYSERNPIPEPRADVHHRSASAGSSYEAHKSDVSYSPYECDVDLNSKHRDLPVPVVDKHIDVSEDEGWITIPCKELPENWDREPDIQSLRPLDRSFLLPGEQVHILACLSACKQDTQITPPFEVAAMTSKNGRGQSSEKESGSIENRNNLVSGEEELSTSGEEQPADVFDGDSLHMEVHKRQTALLLQKFENSHFFVRISESNEPLWSKRSSVESFSNSSETHSLKAPTIKTKDNALPSIGTVIDKGNFDATVCGGTARNSVKCFALPNGDIVVLLQANVSVNFLKDPCIEILQFEKCQERTLSPDSQVNEVCTNQDPCEELLNWILPLENVRPPTRPESHHHLTSNSGISSTSHRSNFSAPTGSPLFAFGNFRSYSMSSLPQTTNTPNAPVKTASSKPNFDLEDWDQISSQNYFWKKTGVEELLSFRGVSLERDRFSVCCGLEGVYIPGRRWRRKLEIIQPVEIHSFAADFNSEDLLCVQIKNVAPAHDPDIMIFIDGINIIFEESTKNGAVSSLPISCVETGNDHSLPNLALRRGEEHSFILKPETSTLKSLKAQDDRNSRLSKLYGNKASKLSLDQYAIMVSCRCNYTSSRLFFKQPTSWRPRNSRDIMISIASQMSGKPTGAYEKTHRLPVQILTLQASNLTSEDLNLTVLAPASFTSPPSVVSLNSPTTPKSPFIGFAEFLARTNGERSIGAKWKKSFNAIMKKKVEQSYDVKAQTVSLSDDVIPSSGISCTHLWLQSRVPLGCIPSKSVVTVKLELLPLTAGIITLDSLQIDVKEKGVAYMPECSMKINSTSSICKELM